MFSVDSTNGNTFIRGNTDAYKNVTIHGSSTENEERLRILDGDEIERFVVDTYDGETYISGNVRIGSGNYDNPTLDRVLINSQTGDINVRGGDLVITGDTTTEQDPNEKLFLQNSTGNLTISGVYNSTAIEVTNLFEANFQINGGQLTVNKKRSGEEVKLFEVEYISPTVNVQQEGGAINFAGQEGFYTHTGARKWVYIDASLDSEALKPNVNYFVAPTATLVLKLPENPITGDMIRVIDVGGNLTYNTSLIIIAPDDVAIQGDTSQSGQVTVDGYGGGELVVQTPNAGLGLVYLGAFNYDGTGTGASDSLQGWWLVEI